MRHLKSLNLAFTILAMVVATCAAAQEQVATQNGVSFISGGIGAGSQEHLKTLEKDFNLKLVFTLSEGNYVADANVVLKNGAGKTLIDHASDGPFFMAKLPAGKYSVTATHSGRTQTRSFTIGSKGMHTEYLRWPSNPKTDFTLPHEATKK